eukprot:COSAG02_NODE_10383_length_1952_cov_2.373988_1_plen_574_part_10
MVEGRGSVVAEMADAAEIAKKLGFPEWKVTVALERRGGDVNLAAEYLFEHGGKGDDFFRGSGGVSGMAPMAHVVPATAPPPDPWINQAAGHPSPGHNPRAYVHPAGHADPYGNNAMHQWVGNNNAMDQWVAPQPAPAPAPYIAPAPAPPPEPPLSTYTATFVSTEPKADHAGFQKWKGVQAWAGPDVRPAHKGLIGHAESGAMEGQRYWPGEGVISKYPNGCQDRCFAAATPASTCALGIFDGSGGENAEKVATVASDSVLQALHGTQPSADGSPHDWQTVLTQAFVGADLEVLRRPEDAWEDSAGCTGVVAVVDLAFEQATVAHVGDSRALHFVPRYDEDTMHAVWQSNDHESTEKAFGNRMRKSSPGDKPTPVPELTTVPGVKDGSVVVLVSDGILNAYPTPEMAVTAMGGQLWRCALARRNPVRWADSRPLLEAALSDHMALTILREAEKAAAKHHEAQPSRFSRDDMSVSLMYVEYSNEAEPALAPAEDRPPSAGHQATAQPPYEAEVPGKTTPEPEPEPDADAEAEAERQPILPAADELQPEQPRLEQRAEPDHDTTAPSVPVPPPSAP